MTEHLKPFPKGVEFTKALIEVCTEIRITNGLIGFGGNDLKTARRIGMYTEQKNNLIIRLLSLRAEGQLDAGVSITRFATEELHPFSRNKITLGVRFDELRNGESISFDTSLSDLRKEGKIEDSLQAQSLAAPATQKPEDRSDFIARSIDEIMDIKAERAGLRKYERLDLATLRTLKTLEEKLVIERLLAFAHTPIAGKFSAHRLSSDQIVLDVAFQQRTLRTTIDPGIGDRTESQKAILASIR